jgi:hypothetical protein
LFESLIRIRDTTSLLGPAARGAVCLLMESVSAAPRRVYIGAGVAALVTGIGANVLLLQIGRHPAPLLAAVAHNPLPASANTAAPAGIMEPVAPHVSPTPISEYSTASAAAPAAAGESRVTQASAPDVTSSIGPAEDKQHQSSAPSVQESGRRSAALAPDQIGSFLRGKPVDDIASGARRPDRALEARICGQADGAEDVATRRALRHFVRAHGLAPTTEISSELVKQLTAAARSGD